MTDTDRESYLAELCERVAEDHAAGKDVRDLVRRWIDEATDRIEYMERRIADIENVLGGEGGVPELRASLAAYLGETKETR